VVGPGGSSTPGERAARPSRRTERKIFRPDLNAQERTEVAQVYRSGRLYGTGRPRQLTPHEVRTRDFAPRRRGVDPGQVRAFQLRLADELAALHRELAMVAQENDRLKRALRDWQSRHARTCQAPPEPPGNAGHR
jgi:DivIVA domain-containing protein